MARKRTVSVWLHGQSMGELTSSATAAVRFTYDDVELNAARVANLR